MLSEGLMATLVTGGMGVLGMLVSRFKCIVQTDGCCSCRSCKFGLLDASIVDDAEDGQHQRDRRSVPKQKSGSDRLGR